jgi:hypothetical protein
MQTCGCCGKHALIGPDSFGSECRAQREWTSLNRAFCDLLHHKGRGGGSDQSRDTTVPQS